MSDVKTVNDKEQETDVLAAANHPEGRMRILGRSGRNYGVYRPGDLGWFAPVDLEGAQLVVQTKIESPAEPRKPKAKDE
jgi:hypothetical protein